MNVFVYKRKDEYPICFLVSKLLRSEIEHHYFDGLNKEDILIAEAYKDPVKKRTSASLMREFLGELKEELLSLKTKYLVVCDSEYYKVVSKETKAEANLGYIKEVDGFKVLYVPDFRSIFYDPERVKEKINRSLTALKNDLTGTYIEPGKVSIQGHYPKSTKEISDALQSLLQYEALTCDIETFSLKPNKAGLATIGFAWNLQEGIAFSIDPSPDERNEEVRQLLKNFFKTYQGKLIFHNIAFDATVLIYQLYMDDITDTEGLLEGMDDLLKNFEDTKLIAYLATNSCAGNELGLKALAQEFTGNYAQEEIADVTKIPLNQLLEYNLTDCISTWFVYNKYYPIMVHDEQEKIYRELFLPSTIDIIQMQLTGLPLNMQRVLEVEKILQTDQEQALTSLKESPCIDRTEFLLDKEWVEKRNAELKVKRVTLEDASCEFNPRSNKHLQLLLYEVLKLPVLEKTPSGAPATDGDTLKALMNHTQDQETLKVLQALIDFSAVDKILTAFIPAFKDAVYSEKEDWYYLIGSFNLGGTISGRLSSSKPNLQNLPSTGSKYAKIIKSCFQAHKGWLFCGLDFNALEARIDALVTKDPAKLAVYINGWDSHMWNCIHYWPEKFHPETFENKEPKEVAFILEKLKKEYKKDRQKSKTVSFAAQYGATYITLVKNCGFKQDEAVNIINNYKKLYRVSEENKDFYIKKAEKDGYVLGAFGLKVRTPLLAHTISGTIKTPKEAEAEKRTASNARFQSYGLLNSRAGVEFNRKVRNSPYRLRIRPVCQIHDAQYFIIDDDPEVILWANKHLVEAVSWQDDPAIYHPLVKLGGEFSIFYPNWSTELTIPNEVKDTEELTQIVKDYLKSLTH